MFENMFEKALKIEKGQQWSISDKKTVDKDAICPVNSSYSPPELEMIVLTNLGPTSVNLIFYAPSVANLGSWKIVPTIAL